MKDLEVRTLGAEDTTDWDSVTKEVTMHSVHGNKRDCAEDERLRKREPRKRGILNMLNAVDSNERYVTEPRCMIEAMMSGAEVPHTPIVRNQAMTDVVSWFGMQVIGIDGTGAMMAMNMHGTKTSVREVLHLAWLNADLGDADATTIITSSISMVFFGATAGVPVTRICGTPMCSLALTSPWLVARCACTPVARRGKPAGAASMRTAMMPTARMEEQWNLNAEDATRRRRFMKEGAMNAVTVNAHVNNGFYANERKEVLLDIEGALGRTEASERKMARPMHTFGSVGSGAAVLQTPNRDGQETVYARGEWDCGMNHDPTTLGTTRPPLTKRTALWRRRDLGPAATKAPRGAAGAASRWASLNSEVRNLMANLRRELNDHMSQALLLSTFTCESTQWMSQLLEEAVARHRHRAILARIAWCSLRLDPWENCLRENEQ